MIGSHSLLSECSQELGGWELGGWEAGQVFKAVARYKKRGAATVRQSETQAGDTTLEMSRILAGFVLLSVCLCVQGRKCLFTLSFYNFFQSGINLPFCFLFFLKCFHLFIFWVFYS